MIDKTQSPVEHVYIHVPFCLRKCRYCSFYSITSLDMISQWFDAVKIEIERVLAKVDVKPETIYFGGGTPSLLDARMVDELINCFDVQPQCEITMEMNPVNINKKYLKELQHCNINRLSVGAQSFHDNQLLMLGRLHDSKQIVESCEMIRNAGFQNFSLDLIYGVPDQKMDQLAYDLDMMIKMNPAHISIYCLSLEKDVPLYKQIDELPEDDDISEMYFYIMERLNAEDYLQYELSNFAKTGYQSKHNLAYWSDKYYLGFGPAASGYLEGFRYTNKPSLDQYCRDIMNNETLFGEKEKISDLTHKQEFVFLGLRKTEGIKLAEFEDRFGEDIYAYFGRAIRKYLDLKLLKINKGYLSLTPEAYFVSDAIFSDLL